MNSAIFLKLFASALWYCWTLMALMQNGLFSESLHPINSQLLASSSDLEINTYLSTCSCHLMLVNLAFGVLLHGGGNIPAPSGPSTCTTSTVENKDQASNIPSDSSFWGLILSNKLPQWEWVKLDITMCCGNYEIHGWIFTSIHPKMLKALLLCISFFLLEHIIHLSDFHFMLFCLWDGAVWGVILYYTEVISPWIWSPIQGCWLLLGHECRQAK